MKTNRIRILIAAAAIAAVPALASASSEQMSLDSCARALVASLAAKSATPLKLREPHGADGEFLIATRYEFMLVAHRARDNAPLARAVCRTDENDQVVELQQQPLTAPAF